jgi:hypothetical protein
MVTLGDGRDAVHLYMREHIARGRDHVIGMSRGEWQRILELAQPLTQAQAETEPEPGEWPATLILEHMTLSLESNLSRFRDLLAGQSSEHGVRRGGSLPETLTPDFGLLCRRFRDTAEQLSLLLAGAGDLDGEGATARHVALGELTWQQWAVYLEVHARDHRRQLEKTVTAVLAKGA